MILRLGFAGGLLELTNAALELRNLLLEDLGAALLASVVVLAFVCAVCFYALATDGFGRVAFLGRGEESQLYTSGMDACAVTHHLALPTQTVDHRSRKWEGTVSVSSVCQ